MKNDKKIHEKGLIKMGLKEARNQISVLKKAIK